MWAKMFCCQERSQQNKICLSWQMAHKNARSISVPQWCARGHLKSDSKQKSYNVWPTTAKHNVRFHMVSLKQNNRSHDMDLITTKQQESFFLFQHSHCGVTISILYESMGPSCKKLCGFLLIVISMHVFLSNASWA